MKTLVEILYDFEDIVVSYTSKVEIPISRYFQVILIRGVFVFGSQVLGLHFLPTLTQELISKVAFVNWYIDYASVNSTCAQLPHVYMYVYISSLLIKPELHSGIGAIDENQRFFFWLLNQISVDII